MTSTPVAGARIKAANTPDPYIVSAACSSTLSISSATAADIIGATITITTQQPNASVMVTGIFDITVSSTGGTGIGTCVVDGATQSGQAPKGLVTSGDRNTVSQMWNVALATAGSHTIKLQGAGTGAGTAQFNTTHTTITALVLDW